MSLYPTDEELMKWIEELEKEPLYAPGHLKEEIMKGLTRQDMSAVQKIRQAKIQMFTYSMKIVAGMAAALFLVFFSPQVPMDHQWQMSESVLQKGTDAINDTSTKIFNKIMTINNLFEQEDLDYDNKEKE